MITIDTETHDLRIPQDDEIFGVYGDVKSKTKKFRIPRFDIYGTDLADCDIRVHYYFSENSRFMYTVSGAEVTPSYIFFQWIIDAIPAKAETIQFMVEFIRTDPQGNVLYSWNTRTVAGRIFEGMDHANTPPTDLVKDEVESLIQSVTEKVTNLTKGLPENIGILDDFQSTREMLNFKPISVYKRERIKIRKDTDGSEYRIQSMTYAPDLKKFIVAGNSLKSDGKAMFTIVDDIETWKNPVNFVIPVGHCNSIEYAESTQCVYATAGTNSSGETESDYPANTIVQISVPQRKFVRTYTIPGFKTLSSISLHNNEWYIFGVSHTNEWIGTRMAIDFTMPRTYVTEDPLVIMRRFGWPNNGITWVGRQDSTISGDYLYRVITTSYNTRQDADSCFILKSRLSDGALVNVYTFTTDIAEEIESVYIMNDNVMYLIADGSYAQVRKGYLKYFPFSENSGANLRILNEGDDLNDLMSSGSYYCWNTDVCGTLKHYPSIKKNGFTMDVSVISGTISQKITTNGNRIYYRRYSTNGWGEWEREVRYTLGYSTSAHVIAPYIFGTNPRTFKKEFKITLPIKICYAEGITFSKCIAKHYDKTGTLIEDNLLGPGFELTTEIHNETAITLIAAGGYWSDNEIMSGSAEMEITYMIQ